MPESPQASDFSRLVNMHAELVSRVDKLLARDPAREFAYGSTQQPAGMPRNFSSFPKAQQFTGNMGTSSVNPNTLLAKASIAVRRWRFRTQLDYAGLATGRTAPMFKLEFGYDENKLEFSVFAFASQITNLITSYTANTGDIQYVFDDEWPLEYTVCRATFGSISNAVNNPQWSAGAAQTFGGNFSQINLTAFGE